MAGYVKKSLSGDERILHAGRFHWLHTIAMLICMCTVVLSPVALVMLIHRVTTELMVTTRRLVLKTGWIMRETEEISLRRLEEVNLDQSVFGRILGYGRLTCRGVGIGEIQTHTIRAPLAFRKAIMDAAQERQLAVEKV